MKSITKLSFAAVAASVITLGTAFADDPQLQNRLALERVRDPQNVKAMATIAVSASGHGIGGRVSQYTSKKSRFELRSNAHGQIFGVFVSVPE